jgi:hypothetical protein
MAPEDIFLQELLSSVMRYHKENQAIVLYRPVYIIKQTWARVEFYAKQGIKPAMKLSRNGFEKFVNLFKWGARSDHVLELNAIIKKYGILFAAKALWKHIEKEKKV